MPRSAAIALALIAAAACAWYLTPQQRRWTREHPLVNPLRVAAVSDGALTLADGRVLRPAGVWRAPGVSAADFDQFLTVATAQGVVITRDLGDGRAFFLAEPRFYNWCGTSRTWAGSYLQCPLSETLIWSRRAEPALDDPLSAFEKWRLEGTTHLRAPGPAGLSADLTAIRFDGSCRLLTDLEPAIEAAWQPPAP